MNIKEALAWAKTELGATSEPESSALVLLGDVLEMSRTEILANPKKGLSLLEVKKFKKYIGQRKKNESVWHIIGRVMFWGMGFKVTNDVLVPRPETELLVEQAIKLIANSKKPIAILDLGTGSGTIAIALAKEFPDVKLEAVDVSQEAIDVAIENAERNDATNITFTRSDLFEKVTGKFDMITANLPYIPSEDMESLAFDVYHYEPKLALDGGPGGLEIYEKMISEVPKYLNPRGSIICEIGINQGDDFKKIAKKYFPEAVVNIFDDLAGIDRIAIIRLAISN